MSAPSSLPSVRQPRRTVRVLSREYKETGYRPEFALGLKCKDEREQLRLHRRLRRLLPGVDIKVLVI
jgi:hypothetical protein